MTNELRDKIFKAMAWELEIQAVLNKIRKDGKERESHIPNPKKILDKFEKARRRERFNRKRRYYK